MLYHHHAWCFFHPPFGSIFAIPCPILSFLKRNFGSSYGKLVCVQYNVQLDCVTNSMCLCVWNFWPHWDPTSLVEGSWWGIQEFMESRISIPPYDWLLVNMDQTISTLFNNLKDKSICNMIRCNSSLDLNIPLLASWFHLITCRKCSWRREERMQNFVRKSKLRLFSSHLGLSL